MMLWRVQEKRVRLTTAADNGWRYRYVCACGHTGRWWIDPNLADGDDHLVSRHGYGDR